MNTKDSDNIAMETKEPATNLDVPQVPEDELHTLHSDNTATGSNKEPGTTLDLPHVSAEELNTEASDNTSIGTKEHGTDLHVPHVPSVELNTEDSDNTEMGTKEHGTDLELPHVPDEESNTINDAADNVASCDSGSVKASEENIHATAECVQRTDTDVKDVDSENKHSEDTNDTARVGKDLESDKKHEASEEIIDCPEHMFGLQGCSITMDDVVGMDSAKDAIKECIFLPLKFPQLFRGRRTPSKAILIYGAPGVGKTYLIKAVANYLSNDVAFINAHACDLQSKYTQDTRRILANIFKTARKRKPSIIFFDEIDVLVGEPSLHLKNKKDARMELLSQITRQHGNEDIFIIAATNAPSDLDPYMRRQFNRRIYIPLPDANEREAMFRTSFGRLIETDVTTSTAHLDEGFKELSSRTDGFSPSDITCIVRDALMEPVRRVQSATHFRKVSGPSTSDPGKVTNDVYMPCSPGSPGAEEISWTDIPGEQLACPALTLADVLKAVSKAKPTVCQEELKKYVQFKEDYGG